MTIEDCYNTLYLSVTIGMLILVGAMVIRSIIGPRITDRILSINMLGTMVICTIAILSQYLGESYLVDVALIYAMISFATVLILAIMFLPVKPKEPKFPGVTLKNWQAAGKEAEK